MPLPLVGAGVKLLGIDVSKQLTGIPVIGGLFKKGSPRYGGNGPLISIVNGFIKRIAAGETAVIAEIWKVGVQGPKKHHRAQWRKFWDTDLQSVPMTPAQRALMISLDPSKGSTLNAPKVNLLQDGAGGGDPNARGGALALDLNIGQSPGKTITDTATKAVDDVAKSIGVSSSTVKIVAGILVVAVVVAAVRR